MGPTSVVGAIELASQVKQAVGRAQTAVSNSESVKLLQNKSLIDVASVARVEPILMVDADCMNIEVLPDIMQAMHSMFSGYYLQAVNMVNTIGSVSVAKHLAPFNPNSGVGFEGLRIDTRKALSLEEYKHKLPDKKDMFGKLAMEEVKALNSEKINDKSISAISEAANLSVGKLFNVNLQMGEQSITVPVAIRLMAHSIPSRVMVELFSNTSAFDTDMAERYHSWKAGRLEFWRDLVLCKDLIDKRIASSIKDDSGILAMIRNRHSGNISTAAINKRASVANATNLAVLSTDTLAGIEQEMGGEFKNSKIRKAVFDSTNLMIVAIVEKNWERVTFYFRGMDGTTNLSYRELKTSGKNDGGNVTDILKAYISGATPSPA